MQRRRLLAALPALAAGPCRALYDAPPEDLLGQAAGSWAGSLTYRDWQRPDRLVRLPCRLVVAPLAADEIALFFRFDDGPGKVVFSYDRWHWARERAELTWRETGRDPRETVYRVTRQSADGLRFEHPREDLLDRCDWQVSRAGWSLTKTEIGRDGTQTLRSRYDLQGA